MQAHNVTRAGLVRFLAYHTFQPNGSNEPASGCHGFDVLPKTEVSAPIKFTLDLGTLGEHAEGD